MNGSEWIVAFRSAVPFPSPARLAAGRERLLAATTTAGAGSPGARRHARLSLFPPWRAVIALSAAAALAAGAGYALTARAGRATSSARSVTMPRTVLAAKVLRDAAKAARSGTVTEPSPGQWIFYETTTASAQHPVPTTSDPEWVMFDGSQTAYYDGPHGPLVVHTSRIKFPPPGMSPWTALSTYGISPKIAWDALEALPASPTAALAVVARHTVSSPAAVKHHGRWLMARGCSAHSPFSRGMASTLAQREFNCLTNLMWNAQNALGGPPAGDAAAFGAMADLPGITVQQGITDAAGAPAIGVSVTGSYSQILLNPTTYQVIGMRSFSTGSGPGSLGTPRGTLLLSSALTHDKLVAHPGDR